MGMYYIGEIYMFLLKLFFAIVILVIVSYNIYDAIDNFKEKRKLKKESSDQFLL